MNTAIVGTAASGGAAVAAAAVAQAQARAAPPATTSAEDSVTISATAQQVEQPTAVQARALRNERQSVPHIAKQLRIDANAVQSHLGAPATAPKG